MSVSKKENVQLFGTRYPAGLTELRLDYIPNPKGLSALKDFRHLSYLGLHNSNIDDRGLEYVSRCESLENINLQATAITDKGIEFLSRLPHLKYLRLKECEGITNASVPFFNAMNSLLDLQIHETDTDENVLQHLEMPGLRSLIIEVWRDNFSYDFLIGLSTRLPNCEILAKGRGTFKAGVFEGVW